MHGKAYNDSPVQAWTLMLGMQVWHHASPGVGHPGPFWALVILWGPKAAPGVVFAPFEIPGARWVASLGPFWGYLGARRASFGQVFRLGRGVATNSREEGISEADFCLFLSEDIVVARWRHFGTESGVGAWISEPTWAHFG